MFDGISCGQVALNRAGIFYDNYYASEIDNNAIYIAQNNYPRTTQLGDVTLLNVRGDNVDLLIGGSPCQGFSMLGKKLNFDDPRSKLFFEYVRIKNQCNPTYFVLENVAMPKKIANVISEYMGVDYISIDAVAFSAQRRKRYYWTNIPIVKIPSHSDIKVKDILQSSVSSKYTQSKAWHVWWEKNKTFQLEKQYSAVLPDKSLTLTARAYGSWNGVFVPVGDKLRRLTPIEWERLQGLPDNYTIGISDTYRYHALGNGFNVDVLAHILSGIHIAESKRKAA